MIRLYSAVLAALTLAATLAHAEDAPRLLLKPSDDHQELAPELPLPKMGFASKFVHGYGARVVGIVFDSEAERLGLEVGDVIVGVNGQRLKTPHDWHSILHDVLHHHDEDVLLYGAPQSGGAQTLLKPKLKPQHEHIITLHIRDWRTGKIYLRETNLNDWE